MSSGEEKEKKKPKIEYETQYDGNVIHFRILDTDHFVVRTQIESKKKGGFSIFRGDAEAESQRKDEWTGFVWEPETGLMPRSVWNEKRKKEILENMRYVVSEVTGSNKNDVRISDVSGTVVPFSLPITKQKCPYCNSKIPIYSKYCLNCGKQLI